MLGRTSLLAAGIVRRPAAGNVIIIHGVQSIQGKSRRWPLSLLLPVEPGKNIDEVIDRQLDIMRRLADENLSQLLLCDAHIACVKTLSGSACE